MMYNCCSIGFVYHENSAMFAETTKLSILICSWKCRSNVLYKI